ncbi:transposase [Arthrobacter sp. TES]|nr:transposase [Arthrobacter sp. TES]
MTTLDLRPSGCPRPGSAWLERQRAYHDDHIALDVTYLAYQDAIDAFQHTDGWTSKRGIQKVNEQWRRDLPEGLEELARLGSMLWPGRAQVPAFYNRGGASNGPVGAINGRLEHC